MEFKHWGIGLLLATASVAQQSNVFSKSSNDSLLWGPYRPNLYFGVRSRQPKSLLTGLLWGRVEDFNGVQEKVRYTCEQNEGMAGYGWDAYDPRTGGIQTIHDRENGIDLETSFVKFDEGRGGWGARIKGTPREDAPPGAGSQAGIQDMKTSVWLTASLEGIGSLSLDSSGTTSDAGVEGNFAFSGQSNELGDFKLTITEPEGNSHPVTNHPSAQAKPLDLTFVHSLQVPEDALWQSKHLVFRSIKSTIEKYLEEYGQDKLPSPWQTYTIPHSPGPGNMHLIQKVFEGPFQFDIFYTPGGKSATSDDLTSGIEAASKAFAQKFEEVNKLQRPYNDDKHLVFSKSLFSNLIGGIGYFYGNQVIDRSYDPDYEEESEGFWQETEEARSRNKPRSEGPYELFTSIPSRPFFPRGFLWDEGFHLLPVVDWDIEIVMQILSSWFNTMDEDGWIAREQILGAEAREKVPPEFRTQYPQYANPPTLFMTLIALLEKIKGADSLSNGQKLSGHTTQGLLADPSIVTSWLKSLYPLLQRNFEWYRRTQWGDLKSYDREAFSMKEGYRWRGRSPRHILTSGLDDYPRPQPPHPGELHVDLISWMGLMSDALFQVATLIGETDDAARYSKINEAVRRNIDDLHWSKENKAYCDATIDTYEESVHVCHKGYISLFPFMTGNIGAEHPHLKDILDLIADENELWSPFGIRSLGKTDELYGTDENYWRSPVWMNMNYLILKELYNVAQQPGSQQSRARTMYSSLRKNLVDTVYASWLETGFAWEQYNPETGKGQRTQHFTGWTSLVVKMMAMPDLGGKTSQGHEEL